jgi:hypothetical protein
VLAYMRRSGHFEVGLDRRPVNFDNGAAVQRIQAAWAEGDDAKGYAILWAATYAFLLDLLGNDAALAGRLAIVHYDDLCADPVGTLRRLHRHCGLDSPEGSIEEQASRIAAPSYYRADLSARDREIIRRETEDVSTRLQQIRSSRQ